MRPYIQQESAPVHTKKKKKLIGGSMIYIW